ncbi:MAG: hypothetical protein FWH02_08035 [Oscillospiraceae bacterium]|nr:hypothetical protein [Oscillospiraceae bacterium]
MIKLIVGSRGSGKTKRLISAVSAAAEVSKGNVVCIEKGDSLRFDLKYNIRLIDINEYGVTGPDAYYGFIAGLLAGNYDITDVFGDATFKILCGKDDKDARGLADFVEKLGLLAKRAGVNVCLTVSCGPDDLPERIQGLIAAGN